MDNIVPEEPRKKLHARFAQMESTPTPWVELPVRVAQTGRIPMKIHILEIHAYAKVLLMMLTETMLSHQRYAEIWHDHVDEAATTSITLHGEDQTSGQREDL